MAGFNLAVLGAVDHIGATNTGVVIGASPVILLALARPHAPNVLVAAALIVVAGAALVNGADARISAAGLAHRPRPRLGGEVGFTLLAAPLLPRLGPMRVAAWAADPGHRELAILTRGDIPTPTATEGAAIAYLAVITTALAFVLWFGAVQQLGAAKAGLLVGLMPVAAVTVDARAQRRGAVHRGHRGDGARGRRDRLRGHAVQGSPSRRNGGSGARFLRDRCRDPQRGPDKRWTAVR